MTETPGITDTVGDLEGFIRRNLQNEVILIATNRQDYLILDFSVLSRQVGQHIIDLLIHHPLDFMRDFRQALERRFTTDEWKSVKPTVRIINFPVVTPIRKIRAEMLGRFLSVEGIIRQITQPVKPKIDTASFRCRNCGRHINVRQDVTARLILPDSCPGCDRTTGFVLEPDRSVSNDYQKARFQENPEGLLGGEQPQEIHVVITGSLCGTVSAGSRATINGVLLANQPRGNNAVLEYFILVNSIEVNERGFEELVITGDDEKKILALSKEPDVADRIIASISPTIYGCMDIKRAIALQLFGGVRKSLPDGTTIRGDIHVLLIGDPGIAKSQMIRHVIGISPRGIYTSGKGSTSAGLTATAVRDSEMGGEGQWTLEAGALVLADMGIAAVDEMDKMRDEDRSALHEVMEQQTVTVAKAGIVATLKARCSLLGAANPKLGRFDAFTSLSEQIDMPPSLLSRFDLLFIMLDKPDMVMDTNISSHIVRTHIAGELLERKTRLKLPVDESRLETSLACSKPPVERDLLRKYIAFSKQRCVPVISPEAEETFTKFYLKLRKLATPDKPMPLTPRQLEALARLGEAAARMRLSEVVTRDDAEYVITILDSCLRSVAYDAQTESFDIDKIASPVSKASRDMIKEVHGIISVVGNGSTVASHEAVVKQMNERGIPDPERVLERLGREGYLMFPRKGLIQYVE